jgi:hypothetical protein
VGLFSALFAKKLGVVPIPGAETLELPRGRVRINYVEATKGRSTSIQSDKMFAGYPPELDVSIRPAAGGDPVTIERDEQWSSAPTVGGAGFSLKVRSKEEAPRSTLRQIRVLYGHVDLPEAGPYTVSVPAFTTQHETFEPRLMFTGD